MFVTHSWILVSLICGNIRPSGLESINDAPKVLRINENPTSSNDHSRELKSNILSKRSPDLPQLADAKLKNVPAAEISGPAKDSIADGGGRNSAAFSTNEDSLYVGKSSDKAPKTDVNIADAIAEVVAKAEAIDCSKLTDPVKQICDACRFYCQSVPRKSYSICNVKCLAASHRRCPHANDEESEEFGCPTYYALGTRGNSKYRISEVVAKRLAKPKLSSKLIAPPGHGAQKRDAGSEPQLPTLGKNPAALKGLTDWMVQKMLAARKGNSHRTFALLDTDEIPSINLKSL